MEPIIHNPATIRKWRKARELTQQEFADAIQVARYTVIKMERGRSADYVSLEIIAKAAAYFKKPLGEFLVAEARKKFAVSVKYT